MKRTLMANIVDAAFFIEQCFRGGSTADGQGEREREDGLGETQCQDRCGGGLELVSERI